MSKVISPTEKKRLAFELDHFTHSKNPHRFRIGWPRKEAAASRAYRRKVTQHLKISSNSDPESTSEIDPSQIKGKTVRKYGVESLRRRVARKIDRRTRSNRAKKNRQLHRQTERMIARTWLLGAYPIFDIDFYRVRLILAGSRSEEELVDYLSHAEKRILGYDAGTRQEQRRERLREIARTLLALELKA